MCEGSRRRLTHGASGYTTKARGGLREKNKEKDKETNVHAPLLFILPDNGNRPVQGPIVRGHVITSLSQNGNCLLSTAWSDNGQLHISKGAYCEH
jgi:hypothetical protein